MNSVGKRPHQRPSKDKTPSKQAGRSLRTGLRGDVRRHSLSLSLTHTLTHTHTLSLSHTHTHTNTLSLSLFLLYTHTHTHTHKHTHTHLLSLFSTGPRP